MNVNELLELEREMWDALVAGDPATDAALLSEDLRTSSASTRSASPIERGTSPS
jgi:hypothetical protein